MWFGDVVIVDYGSVRPEHAIHVVFNASLIEVPHFAMLLEYLRFTFFSRFSNFSKSFVERF